MKIIPWNNNKIIAFTTTIEMGNMAFQVGDKYEEVLENRKQLYSILDLSKENIVFTYQYHSDVVKEVTKDDLSKGSTSFESGVRADALYTKRRDIALGIFHADCVPVFLYHPSGLVAIIHAGFIGTLKSICYKTIKEISEKEGIEPHEFHAYIGPARRIISYKVNDEELLDIKNANADLFILNKENGVYFDMIAKNIVDLIKAGVKLENIVPSHLDTVSDNRFYSAYKKTPLGRMVSIIKLI